MGFLLTVSEANERLGSQDNLVNKIEIKSIPKHEGGFNGRNGRGRELQERAASLARVLPLKTVSEITGYSRNQVNNLKRGFTSHPEDGPDEGLRAKIEEKVVEIRDEAVTKLMLAMGMIKEENLSRCNARDLSIVASNMSKVVERTLPKEDSRSNVNLIVYAPQQKSLRDFEVVEV